MKKSSYTDEQIVSVLREAERGEQSVRDFCRSKGLNETTFYKWKKRFGSMDVSEVKKARELELENARLKRLLAERDIEIDVLKEVLAKKW